MKYLLVALLLQSGAALAQEPAAPVELTGTLAKVRNARAITIAFRESSVPFSYRAPRGGMPIGYSIELCKSLADAIALAVGRELETRWLAVTSETRIGAIANGLADLECGSTTNNAERRREVAFSPVIFVSGTKLLVPMRSPIRSFRDLGGKKVIVTAGTTNEKAMKDIARNFKLDFELRVGRDHAESFARLEAGDVDAFATDDVLLYGLVAEHKAQKRFHVGGEFLSYDAYGIMFRKDDAQLAEVVKQAFHDLAEDGEIERQYKRWFMRPLPSGATIGLPMSAQLEELIGVMALRPE